MSSHFDFKWASMTSFASWREVISEEKLLNLHFFFTSMLPLCFNVVSDLQHLYSGEFISHTFWQLSVTAGRVLWWRTVDLSLPGVLRTRKYADKNDRNTLTACLILEFFDNVPVQYNKGNGPLDGAIFKMFPTLARNVEKERQAMSYDKAPFRCNISVSCTSNYSPLAARCTLKLSCNCRTL